MNIMSGYSMTIRPLTEEDIRVHSIDMGDRNPDLCIAVEGEDLGPALCAVIEMRRDCPDPLVWSQVPNEQGGENDGGWHEITDSGFADAVAHVVSIVLPEVVTN